MEVQKHEPSFVGFMSRHFVALICDYESTNSDGSVFHRGSTVLSGFLLELHDQWYWVTAGHCLQDELDKNIKSGRLRIFGGSFMDYFGNDATDFHSVPFTYECGQALQLMDDDLGLDFALLPLDGNKRRLFEANGLVPVSRANWLHHPEMQFELYKMLGIPTDQVFSSDQPDGTTLTQVRPVMADVQRFIIPPDDPNLSKYWFAGVLHEEVTLETVRGMSGGPIYGFRRDENGQWKYHVVALQSWWDPKTRKVFGCSLQIFAEALHQMLQPPND